MEQPEEKAKDGGDKDDAKQADGAESGEKLEAKAKGEEEAKKEDKGHLGGEIRLGPGDIIPLGRVEESGGQAKGPQPAPQKSHVNPLFWGHPAKGGGVRQG
ncbi:hypothetical protein GCM10007315_27760 [Gemmobacter tilapiae]|uniref:Uncharacterized protein n=1 Tax=Neogemmobacter tilapiae TaxID=875041 RepID=A0A918TVM9_9RHOB|nr:hypothetical protein GCM10007315_27760 [Gemmobacter tilapiae]